MRSLAERSWRCLRSCRQRGRRAGRPRLTGCRSFVTQGRRDRAGRARRRMSLVNEVDGVAVTEHFAVGRDRALCRPTRGIFLGEGTSDLRHDRAGSSRFLSQSVCLLAAISHARPLSSNEATRMRTSQLSYRAGGHPRSRVRTRNVSGLVSA